METKEEELERLRTLYRFENEIFDKYNWLGIIPNHSKDNGSVYKDMLEERIKQIEELEKN